MLRDAGYATAVRGKWHLACDMEKPNAAWPTFRGFDSFWGTLTGCGSFYQPGTLTRNLDSAEHETLEPGFFYTDRIAEEAVSFLRQHRQASSGAPFFLYVAFTAPHYPVHARPETIASYDGVYDSGWDAVRAERYRRQRGIGLVDDACTLSARDPAVPAWDVEPNPVWQARRMQGYAAQVEEMDRAIGSVLAEIESQGVLDDTLVMFLSDNGASDESLPLVELERFRERSDIVRKTTRDGRKVAIGNDPDVDPGGEDTYGSYGRGWANVSNTPFRLYKLWTHEGGIAAPFIARWPGGGLPAGDIRHGAYQLTDVVPTLLEATGAVHREERDGVPVHDLAGESMLSWWRGAEPSEHTLWWEHVGNGALRRGRWKLVRQHGWGWELYDLEADRSELHDLAGTYPEVVDDLVSAWETRARRAGVIPFEETMRLYHERGLTWKDAIG
jgi:arylsulfatase A-like enzyme